MLNIPPPEFTGSLQEQLAQSELWTRNFLNELDVELKNLEVAYANSRMQTVNDTVINRETIYHNWLVKRYWTIILNYEQDNEIYQDEYGWLVQRSTTPSDIGNIKSELCTDGVLIGATSSFVLAYIAANAPKQYAGTPAVFIQGNSFFVFGEQDDEQETED